MNNNPISWVDPDGGCEKCKPDNITGKDYWWDGKDLIPMGREVVFEGVAEAPQFLMRQFDQFVPAHVDAVSYEYAVPRYDLPIFKRYAHGLNISSSGGDGGGPG